MCQISKWAFQLISSFKSDPGKQDQEVFLVEKLRKFLILRYILTALSRKPHMLWKLQKNLPRLVLMTIYKSFVREHLDYSDVIDQAYNETFHKKLESIQYNACLALFGFIRGLSKKTLPRIRLGISPTSRLVQETLLIF